MEVVEGIKPGAAAGEVEVVEGIQEREVKKIDDDVIRVVC